MILRWQTSSISAGDCIKDFPMANMSVLSQAHMRSTPVTGETEITTDPPKNLHAKKPLSCVCFLGFFFSLIPHNVGPLQILYLYPKDLLHSGVHCRFVLSISSCLQNPKNIMHL